jgi:hypothetical protein
MNTLLEGGVVLINNWKLIVGLLVFVVTILYLIYRIKPDLIIGSRQGLKPTSLSTSISLAFFIFLLLLVRLAYVFKALFPSYFDSAQHYTLIQNIVTGDMSQVFTSLLTDYYHLGFHFFTASLINIFQTEITTTILIFGQVILAVLPLPFFFIVRYVTGSNWAGMFAVALAAFGWYMPAHASDWGKYPALMSMGMILVVISLIYIFVKKKDELQAGNRILFIGMLGFTVLFAFFVHSRSVIVLSIVVVGWSASILWHRLPSLHKHMVFGSLFITLILMVIYVERSDVLSLLFDPYLHKGIWITALICALSIFACQNYPDIVFTNVLIMCLLLVTLFIPVGRLLPGYDHLTLMDRPYMEMILFMPLSLIGGLGLAGLESRVGSLTGKYISIIFFGFVILHAFIKYDFYPSDCCVIVGNDDIAAIVWMEEQLPIDARIGISSMELKVVESDVVEGYAGADAGIWITSLTDRAAIPLPHDLDFGQQSSLGILCRRESQYLFVGEVGRPFDTGGLKSHPEWYRPLLSMPKTGVYEVTGCDDV